TPGPRDRLPRLRSSPPDGRRWPSGHSRRHPVSAAPTPAQGRGKRPIKMHHTASSSIIFNARRPSVPGSDYRFNEEGATLAQRTLEEADKLLDGFGTPGLDAHATRHGHPVEGRIVERQHALGVAAEVVDTDVAHLALEDGVAAVGEDDGDNV